MGNTNDYPNLCQTNNTSAQTQHSCLNSYQEEYHLTYQKIKNHNNFFCNYIINQAQFLHQCPNFGNNLKYLFPYALRSPQQYFEMVTYLRKYDSFITSNQEAQQNCHQTTLLDRFFMICLGNLPLDKYKQMKLSKLQIQLLVLDYYKLFVEQPKINSVLKLLKFIDNVELSNPQELIEVKKFAEKLREFFPHVQKYLKDYYFAKFHQGNPDYRILKHFKSQIVYEDAVILALKLPQLQNSQITELYNSDDYGTGFYMLEKRMVGYTGPWLMLIKHSQKGFLGHRQRYIFGSYQNGPIKDVSGYQGDLSGFMFTLQPNIKFMTVGNGHGGSNYFFISTGNEIITKHKKGLGFGGNSELTNFKLWIDENMDKSTVFNGYDNTYGQGVLAGKLTETLDIQRVQVWALGSEQNLRDQERYWAERNEEIVRIRKVNKRQFLNESQAYLENVLGNKEKYGQLQKEDKKRQSSQSSYPSFIPWKGKQNENPL